MTETDPRFIAVRIGITAGQTVVIDTTNGGFIVASHMTRKAANADAARRNFLYAPESQR